MNAIPSIKRAIAASTFGAALGLAAISAGIVVDPAVAEAARNGVIETGSTTPSQHTPGKSIKGKTGGTTNGGVSQTVNVARYSGAPLGSGPGAATGAECRAFADAVNAIVDQVESDVMAGRDTGYDANEVVNGIIDAGRARGCVFMAS